MTDRYDAIVVGAGHNGLVCAALLARAGRQVLVLEAADRVGGAATTHEFAPGFSVSSGAHLLYQWQPAVQKALGLRPSLAADDLQTVALSDAGEALRIGGRSVSGVSDSDAAEYAGFRRRTNRFADVLEVYLNALPPRLGSSGRRDILSLARLGFEVRRLGRDEMREFLRLVGMNIHDELTERFENPLLKGAIALDAVLGTHLGPRSPNTIMTYLHRLAGNHGRMSIPAGGMGRFTDELARIARDAGVTIRTGSSVGRIVVENGRITGVETAAGERFDSLTVVSNVDPKRTVMQLVGARHFETGFVRRIEHLRARGNAAKLHLALDGAPAFAGLTEDDLRQRLIIAPDEHYVERAFNPAKYGEASPEPVVEITIPSLSDPTLAPTGKHVLSAVVQYAPYDLRSGWSDAARDAFGQSVIRTIARYSPGLEDQLIAREVLTPRDLEARFGMTGGHWHHSEMSLDQFLFVRPVGGSAQYALPIDGLYLCGAGAHAGGGVSGAAGRNAAEAILHRERLS
jgi:phytoene dehydrogenase-like protein